MVVDEELALPHLDAIAGQADHAFDPGLRAVTRSQRNTTTSPRFGVPENTRPVSGRVI